MYLCTQNYMYRKVVFFILLLVGTIAADAQLVTLSGRITDDESKQPVEFVSILIKENGYWAITDGDGLFSIKNMPVGKATMTIQCLGYATRQLIIDVKRDIPRLRITLKQESLKLDEVMVTAHRKKDEATTSYIIDRTTLDNQQLINVGDIGRLTYGST